MKFIKWEGLEKHLTQSEVSQLSNAYLVALAEEEEQKAIIRLVVEQFLRKIPEISIKRSQTLAGALEHLQSPSFFSSSALCIWEIDGKISKEEFASLIHYLENPVRTNYFLLSTGSSECCEKIYAKAKKEIVVLNLVLEKPWDKEARLKQFALKLVADKNKQFAPQAMQEFLSRVEANSLSIEKEIEKLICASGENKEIALQDVEELISEKSAQTGWEMAEKLVWKTERGIYIQDMDEAIALLAQVRYHLELGLQLAYFAEKRASFEEIGQQFPKLRPARLQFYLQTVQTKGLHFFIDALKALFEIEFSIKTGDISLSPKVFATWLEAKLR